MWKSNGWCRLLGVAVTALGQGMRSDPRLEPFADMVTWLGVFLGGVGTANAKLQ